MDAASWIDGRDVSANAEHVPDGALSAPSLSGQRSHRFVTSGSVPTRRPWDRLVGSVLGLGCANPDLAWLYPRWWGAGGG